MKGKLIIIEGTDCSGKQTQSQMIVERLKGCNIEIEELSFPMYDTPTGKIIGGPYLGNVTISEGYFLEGASNVDSKVSCLYYAADRKYNIGKIINLLDNGINVLLDRYTTSNMAHQGGKIEDEQERLEMYKWIEKLEWDFLEMPRPDICIFLHMPYEFSLELKKNRAVIDQNEKSKDHLLAAEKAYLELAQLYNFKTIECIVNNKIRSKKDINDEIFEYLKKIL